MMKVTNLNDEQIIQLGNEIGDAFFDYPYANGQRGICEVADTRDKMRKYLTAFIKVGYESGLLYATSSRMEGIIIITSSKDQLKLIPSIRFLKGIIGAIGLKGIFKMIIFAIKGGNDYSSVLKKKKIPYVELQVLGVRKQYWSQGYMRQLMEMYYKLSDERNMAMHLETDDRNKALRYQHLGMKLVYERYCADTFTIYELYKEK